MIKYGTSIFLEQFYVPYDNNLKFSNTMKWDKKIKEHFHDEKDVDQSILKLLRLPPPPLNDSLTTMKEIHDLLLKKEKRNASIQKEIELEMEHLPMIEYFSKDKEDIKNLLELNQFISPYIYYFKKLFDRVRPRILEPEINPTIPPPGHPSYPSGHATQAYSFALFLNRKNGGHRNKLMRIANKIATNREMAGVHYASDTLAGMQLAAQLVDIYLKKRLN